jgi:hypothetical protein
MLLPLLLLLLSGAFCQDGEDRTALLPRSCSCYASHHNSSSSGYEA